MEKAKSLLVNSDLTIKAIAVTVGYKGSKKFTPIFKKHFGQSPTDYRNNFFSAT
jgi:transcriptional regulator GlxA family with amidase domain